MAYTIVAYFTPNDIYDSHMKRLVKSLCDFNLPYFISPITDQGGWIRNVQYKPTFLKKMMNQIDTNLVYLDVDAMVCGYPFLFDTLDRDNTVNLAVHTLDHSEFKRTGRKPEMLSGTLFLRNNDEVRKLLDSWIAVCKNSPTIWDQKALEVAIKALNFQYSDLPPEYCTIFDYMNSVQKPVIKHYQASREVKANVNKERKVNKPKRKVFKNGTVRLSRKRR